MPMLTLQTKDPIVALRIQNTLRQSRLDYSMSYVNKTNEYQFFINKY